MNEALLSNAELELIEAIRNIRKAYPNGYENLVWYAQQLFDELVEMPPADSTSRGVLKRALLKTTTQLKYSQIMEQTMKSKLSDILLSITWRDIARRYFGKSSSWLYHKMDGIDGNGGTGKFSDDEAQMLKSALYDLSDRIKAAADNI